MAHIVSDSREAGIFGAVGAFIREACHAAADAQHRLTAFSRKDARADNEIARLGLTQGKIAEYVLRGDKH